MANVRLKNIQFPGLDNTYTIPDEAPAYSTSGTYAVGDMVIYDGKLYKCTTAITTAEAWTAAHWSETKMGNEVSELKNALNYEKYNFYPDFSALLGVISAPTGWRTGGYSGDGTVSSNTRYMRSVSSANGNIEIFAPEKSTKLYAKAPNGYYISIVEYKPDTTFVARYGVANNVSGTGTNEVEITPKENYIYRFYIGMTASGVSSQTLIDDPTFMSQIVIYFTIKESQDIAEIPKSIYENTYNYTIMCAKEENYKDGTPPTTNLYLVLAPNNNLYITKDFSSFKLIRNPVGGSYYKYAIMKNNDIICVFRTELYNSGSSDAAIRKNPYVLIASENWEIAHEVDFGNNLKPSGWLENCGFCSMPDGSAMFAEYTRPSVQTSNCWKISGDLTDPTNWVVKKSFTLSGANTGFKHCHAINYDFYNDVYYLCTGDDDTGAQVWYSTDDGDTWTQAREASEKYCRMLNMIFTPEYIYWASDTTATDKHYLFRCERNASNIIDYSTITELANLYESGIATYGISYMRNYNLLVLLDRADGDAASMPLRAYDLSNNELITIGTIYSATGDATSIGFRTEYSEFNPVGNSIKFGFGKSYSGENYRNLMKGVGNVGNASGWNENVNNLKIIIYKNGENTDLVFKTAFMPDT